MSDIIVYFIDLNFWLNCGEDFLIEYLVIKLIFVERVILMFWYLIFFEN